MNSIESEIKAGYGVLLAGIKNLSESIKTLWTAMIANPFSAVIASIGLLIPAIQSLISVFSGGAEAVEKQAHALRKAEDDSTATRHENQSVALESDIADERRRAREQAIREVEREDPRSLRGQPRQRGGAIINRDIVGQPAAVTAEYREREREVLEHAVNAVKEGTTAQLTRQLAEAIAQRDAQTAAVLREAIALLKQSASQRVNDPRR